VVLQKIRKIEKGKVNKGFYAKIVDMFGNMGKEKNRKECKMNDLLDSYVRDDLKYRQIALNENINIRTVQRWLDKNEFKKIIVTI